MEILDVTASTEKLLSHWKRGIIPPSEISQQINYPHNYHHFITILKVTSSFPLSEANKDSQLPSVLFVS